MIQAWPLEEANQMTLDSLLLIPFECDLIDAVTVATCHHLRYFEADLAVSSLIYLTTIPTIELACINRRQISHHERLEIRVT